MEPSMVEFEDEMIAGYLKFPRGDFESKTVQSLDLLRFPHHLLGN
jgi:hypothetical protein